MLRKKWIAGCITIVVSLLLNWYAECIPLRLWAINDKSETTCFRLMSFNIKGTSKDFPDKAEKIAQVIKYYSPDIVFVSEIKGKNKLLLDSLLEEVLPVKSYSRNATTFFYSSHNLEEWKKLRDDENYPIGVYKCRAIIGKDTIQLYGCHLASNNYTLSNRYVTPDSISNQHDIKTYCSNIRHASIWRVKEAKAITSDINESRFPLIIMGDMNDVGGSSCINELKRVGLKDAWWEGGFGYGSTIHTPLPYRIDHIMYSNGLRLLNIKVIDSMGLSDHDALYAGFEI